MHLEILKKFTSFLDSHLALHLVEKSIIENEEVTALKHQLKARKHGENGNIEGDALQKFNSEEAAGIQDLLKNGQGEGNSAADSATAAGGDESAVAAGPSFDKSAVVRIQQYSRAAFDCGKYAESAAAISTLTASAADRATTSYLSYESKSRLLWGLLASDLMSVYGSRGTVTPLSTDRPMDTILALRDQIEKSTTTPQMQKLLQRSWLCHWAVLVALGPFGISPSTSSSATGGDSVSQNGDLLKNRRRIIDLLLTPVYLNAIQTTCPYLLRYLTAIVVLSVDASDPQMVTSPHITDLIKILDMEAMQYMDHLTQTVLLVLHSCDFESATTELKMSESMVAADTLIQPHSAALIDNLKGILMHVVSRVHVGEYVTEIAAELSVDRGKYAPVVPLNGSSSAGRALSQLKELKERSQKMESKVVF